MDYSLLVGISVQESNQDLLADEDDLSGPSTLADKVVETEEHATEATSGVVRKAKKAASVAFGKAKETVYEYEERAKDVVGLGDTKEKVSE
nr:MORN motif-containing protein [Tanacetum cinerariifolium]